MMLAILFAVFLAGSVQGQASQQVAFSTGLTHDATLLHAENVLYDKVYANVGNAYDPTTGIFTAPISGVYVFQYHTMAHQDKSTWLELYHNADYIESIFGHTANDKASAGNSVVLKLAKGDTVYVKAVDNQYGTDTNIYGQPDEVYSTFSGFLVAPVFSEVPAVGK